MREEHISAKAVPEKLKGKNVKAIDAFNIVSKGAVKQNWRLHYTELCKVSDYIEEYRRKSEELYTQW